MNTGGFVAFEKSLEEHFKRFVYYADQYGKDNHLHVSAVIIATRASKKHLPIKTLGFESGLKKVCEDRKQIRAMLLEALKYLDEEDVKAAKA